MPDGGILLISAIVLISIIYFALRFQALNRITAYKLSSFNCEALVEVDKFDRKIENISQDDPSIDLSIVFPAYNEENRLVKTLDETLKYLHQQKEKNKDFTYELIIVDDGSRDGTSLVARQYMEKNFSKEKDNIRLIPLVNNYGKGFAVKQGVIRSRGKLILMADADAATEISDLERLTKKLNEHAVGNNKEIHKNKSVAIGSRSHLQNEDTTANRKLSRKLTSWIFNFLVMQVAGIKKIKDTQCGFKLFTRESARLLFLNLHVNRWCFDIELLIVANYFKIPVEEVPVNWEEVDGSHLNLWGMASTVFDLFLIRVNHLLRFWKVTERPVLKY
ncbi:dolichyl- phosphate beta-glucosyltransferase [Acrasis kona]|uniref:dolichyl-phosphate beta-glucosyltransferase n=1 Tax=Acrasis kona TaxID=1008807 RepID=A0AAW2YVK8_9EUKA